MDAKTIAKLISNPRPIVRYRESILERLDKIRSTPTAPVWREVRYLSTREEAEERAWAAGWTLLPAGGAA